LARGLVPGPCAERRNDEKLVQRAKSPAEWSAFALRYRAETATPESSHAIALLAALSHQSDFSVGCCCKDESHCHRSALCESLAASGAKLKA
jgi:uncharacterized protein YeaO (DUF488 family)